MAIALKCDICGKYYDFYDNGYNTMSLSRRDLDRVSRMGSYKDCCPDCIEAIKNCIDGLNNKRNDQE